MIDFPNPVLAPQDEDLVAISQFSLAGELLAMNPDLIWPKQTVCGSSWDVEVILEAYRRGMFPMPFEIDGRNDAIGWWSPSIRAVFRPETFKPSTSTVKAARSFTVSCDTAFESVVRACADPRRDHGWIDEHVVAKYCELHARGQAHSVEVWQSGHLVGGLYGVEIGSVFAGESMFHTVTNASKVALMALMSLLNDGARRLVDAQWMTAHLKSLGAIPLTREEYCRELAQLRDEKPAIFAM